MRRRISVFAMAACAAAVTTVGIVSQLPGSADETPAVSRTPGATGSAAVGPKAGLDADMLVAMRRDLKLDDDIEVAERLRADAISGIAEQRLRADLGTKFAGAWVPRGGSRLTVAVTDDAAAARARAAGVDVKVVKRSQRQLDSAKSALDRSARQASDKIHSWYVDPSTNMVVVAADRSAVSTAREFAADSGVAADAFRVVAAKPMRPVFDVRGGDQISINDRALCSVGFAVVGGYLTAGHCGDVGNTVKGFNGVAQGTFRGSTFPRNDHAFVQTNANWTPQPLVNNHSGGTVSVAGATEAAIGASVCRSGRTTGWRCGVITAKNITVNYTDGPVVGLTNTTACAEPGDSGGAVISGNQAQGITSGAGGNCRTGGSSVYQPVNPALSAYNAKLVTTGTGAGGGTTAVSLKSNLNSRCIDIPSSNTVDGAHLQMWDCNNTGAQKWTLGADGTVRALGKCMDARDAGTADGTAVQLFACNGQPNQRFALSAAGDLVSVHANKCVDITNVNPAIGAKLQLWTCTGGANQKWSRA